MALALAATSAGITPASAQANADRRPYDQRLMRLAEILGATHYLRELCGANDEQLWRQHMQALIKTEGSTALRRAELTRNFNRGYRNYQRTYSNCTPSAKTAIQRFMDRGAAISHDLATTVR
ncbi:MAG: TIGR02301 family protein [Pseudomonadota bacterium]